MKVNLLCALMLCVQQLDRKSTEPYIHRYVVHICVQHLSSPEVRDLCQAILVKICSIDITDNAGSNASLHVREVISALASSTSDNGDEIDDSPYVAALLAGQVDLQKIIAAQAGLLKQPSSRRTGGATCVTKP